MTKMRLLALLAVVALVLFPAIAFAEDVPVQPCRFYGTVQEDGADVDAGTIITAMIGGAEVATTTTPAAGYGASSYAITIAQTGNTTIEGKTVTFKIGASSAVQTGTWEMGGNTKLNLTVGEPPIIPGGGAITSVQVTSLPAGSTPTVDYNKTTGVLKLGIPQGEKGAIGATGAAGAMGEPGKDASNVFGIIAIVIAAIALLVAAMVMLRKKPA